MTYKDGKRGKEMLLVPIGGRPQPVVVNNINKTLRCEMFACAFDETWDDDVEVLLYVNDAGKFAIPEKREESPCATTMQFGKC